MLKKFYLLLTLTVLSICCTPTFTLAELTILELSCPSCGYRDRFAQGSDDVDQSHNVQNIIVVCERNRQIRNVKIPLDPGSATTGEPLIARRSGNGKSDILGIELPRFLIPGNTCPLFPVAAYLEANICPIDGSPGFNFTIIGHY